MITPEEFPYITSIHVNDCYAYQDFDIPLFDYKPFSHLILTGKNGSGKSTILRGLNGYFVGWRMDDLPYTGNQNLIRHIFDLEQLVKSRSVTHGLQDGTVHALQNELKKFTTLTIFTSFDSDLIWKQNKNTLLYSYFRAERNDKVDKVEAPSKETEFSAKLNSPDSTEFFVRKFKQYLVNQKVEQAFSQIDNQASQIEWVSQFFKKIEETFRKMFADDAVSLEFIRSDYEFYIKLSNDRRVTFDTLSEGFSALLSILMDLFTRIDLIRKQVKDFAYNPCGIVLIDEPETHLHLQLQEQVLPLLTNLFPNIQFIVATHSPAVVASIKKVTVFDVATKDARTDEVVGRSYSELMMRHFGLNNEYSSIADDIFKKINQVLRDLKDKPDERRRAIQNIVTENESFISPSFMVELESIILENA